ncbi:hypothetical protein SAMN06295888_14513 [Desulfonatronum zhilinae]|nr:hypothetical protein SAMN06295888_14513 [Desulfonatronum zhilinae]
MHDLKSRRKVEAMSGNLHGRIRRLERGWGKGDCYPLVIAQGEGETVDQAVDRHVERFPGLGAWLAKHPGKPLIVLDGEHGDN